MATKSDDVSRLTLRTWWTIMGRVRHEIRDDQVPLVAAGVAFYWLLAVFPALAAGVSLWALVGDPATFNAVFETYGGLVPPEVVRMVQSQVAEVSATSDGALTFGALVGFLASMWVANTGVKGLVSGLNIAWDLPEDRGILAANLIAFSLLALGFGVGVLASLFVAAMPVLQNLGLLPVESADALYIARWPLLALAMVSYLSVLYRVAPCRRAPPRAYLTPGALMATVAFLLVSVAFSAYVQNFGAYNEMYGSLGGGVVLLLWFWLTAIAVLFGAEVDSEIEQAMHGHAMDTVPMRRRPVV
ncbi:MAG: YihY/virulence factor BrkB family protein [Myxococcales bacterium]|nr:YihY/virulence factor BrkB family protein [Myxococcales bacterium]